jgi:hypothetical protein
MKKSYFKFTLSYKHFIISQTIRDSDVFSQQSHQTVNLRDFIKPLIKDFQNVLSTNTTGLDFELNEYNLIDYKKFMCMTYKDVFNLNNKTGYSEDLKENSEYGNGFVFRFTYGDEKILEREFPVRDFNINSLFSKDLYDVTLEWVDRIMDRVKNQDSNIMWDNIDLAYHYNISEEDVSNLTLEDRRRKLDKISKKEIIW